METLKSSFIEIKLWVFSTAVLSWSWSDFPFNPNFFYHLRIVTFLCFFHIFVFISTSQCNGPFSPWWRHQMKTFSALLALCVGNLPVPVNSPHKGQWRGALMFSLIYVWINGWVNKREAGDLRRHRCHYDVNVMLHLNRNHFHSPSFTYFHPYTLK